MIKEFALPDDFDDDDYVTLFVKPDGQPHLLLVPKWMADDSGDRSHFLECERQAMREDMR